MVGYASNTLFLPTLEYRCYFYAHPEHSLSATLTWLEVYQVGSNLSDQMKSIELPLRLRAAHGKPLRSIGLTNVAVA